ncbi:MAG: DUF3179 domain-containing (seleno)protein, partial [Bacteroidota bacterium]
MKQLLCLSMLFLFLTCEDDIATVTSSSASFNPTESSNTSGNLHLVQDEFNGLDLVIVGQVSLQQEIGNGALSLNPENDLSWDFAVAFEREVDGVLLEFETIDGRLPIIIKDSEGNEWDLFGKAVSGPRQGQQLQIVNAAFAYWFTYGTLYPGTEIFNNQNTRLKNKAAPSEDWDVSTQTIIDAAGFDGIPSLENPKMVDADDPSLSNYLQEDERVVGLLINDRAYAYPIPILDWHEVINDEQSGQAFTITYCPLTATTKVYDRSARPSNTFGVSGLLYNSNLMPYDRETRSIWLQLEGRSVHGNRRGDQVALMVA